MKSDTLPLSDVDRCFRELMEADAVVRPALLPVIQQENPQLAHEILKMWQQFEEGSRSDFRRNGVSSIGCGKS